jgi:hypothetical protein
MYDNQFFKSGDNIFQGIGTEGFTLYTYFMYEQNGRKSFTTTIKTIQTVLSRDYIKRPTINYGKKETRINCMKDKDTITNYIKTLIRNNLIVIHNIESIKEKHKIKYKNEFDLKMINVNEVMIIEVISFTYDKGFFYVPSNLFYDYIHKIGHIGWSLLCYLSKEHNPNFGNPESNGFAARREDEMEDVIHRGRNTISAYLYLLQSLKLIKIEPQEPMYKPNKFGKDEIVYMPNHYIVKWRLSKNIYYMNLNKKEDVN